MRRLNTLRPPAAPIVLAALLLPASAAAYVPGPGHYSGHGVSLNLVHHDFAGSWISDARHHGHSDLDHAW